MIWPIFACAALMRIKGGGHAHFVEWVNVQTGSRVLDLVLGAKFLSTVGFGLVCLLVGYPWWQAVLGAFGWLIGVAPSIGEEIGAVGGYKGNWPSDRDSWFGARFVTVKSDRMWGWLSGAFRGLWLGLCLAIPLMNPWFALAGVTFPAVYWVGVSVEQWRTGQRVAPWDWAEWFYGAVLGAAFLAG